MLELYKILILGKFITSEFKCSLVHFYTVLGINSENG